MRRHGQHRLTIWLGDMRLPADERRAAQSERRVEAEMRSERDFYDHRARQRAAMDAEIRRHQPYRT